ncbi:MAG: hypothetical protein AAGB19_22420 [Cyanobacteria bacterium P01_F01_bin.3]
MRINFKQIIRYLAASLLLIPLSGCQLIYVAQLETERMLRPTETLPNTATTLEDCQVNQPCERSFPLQLNNWATDPWPKIDSGELPPGLSLTIQSVPEQPNDYGVILEGTPTTVGSYSFQVGLECCMTMSGPSEKVRSEDITLSVTQ